MGNELKESISSLSNKPSSRQLASQSDRSEQILRIDTTFNFQSDTPPGRDPDAGSLTLRRYHRFLWSKPLPSGFHFELDDSRLGVYLHHRSELGEFWLSSDSIIASFARYRDPIVLRVVEQVPADAVESFRNLGYTMGGMLIFPCNQVSGKHTINCARGLNSKIRDRFDLTLECIRRHYKNEGSPLEETLQRYIDFFGLFGSFRGYVEFFLLQDLVDPDFSSVRFFLPFDDFCSSPFPSSKECYLAYMQRNIEFIESRNLRILAYCEANNLPVAVTSAGVET